MTVFDIAMEALTEHREVYGYLVRCFCGESFPDEAAHREHVAAVFAERFGEVETNLRLIRRVIRNSSTAPNVLDTIDFVAKRALALLDGEKQISGCGESDCVETRPHTHGLAL